MSGPIYRDPPPHRHGRARWVGEQQLPCAVQLPVMRVGMPETTGWLPIAAEQLDVPVLVSATRLWDAKKQRFRPPGFASAELDMALDSAGFTVMKKWGGCYPWSIRAYVELGVFHPWAWWSQPDLCCEPEIAGNQSEVNRRIDESAEMLREARRITYTLVMADFTQDYLRGALHWVEDYEAYVEERLHFPMPVLQGQKPDDYRRSVAAVGEVLGERWPSMIGVGSMCRRHVHGDDGILAVLGVLDELLPRHTGVHLFGVKGEAIPHLVPWLRRVVSLDSMAWDRAARWDQNNRPEGLRPLAWRAEHMKRWVQEQDARLAELCRRATAEQLLGRLTELVRQRLPDDLSPAELNSFLQRNTEQLLRQLADQIPVTRPSREHTVR